jgi:tetratricopeptide (TPR) repeat protein
MQSQVEIKYPKCSCCGEHLDKKHMILDGLFQCPKCKNEHYFLYEYKTDMIHLLSEADHLRNDHHYEESFSAYEKISQNYPSLIEAHWGMFLSTYGVVYREENKNSRYVPAIHQFYDETPLKNKHYLKVMELAKDKYMKNNYFKEGELITKTWESAKTTLKKIKPIKVKEPVTQTSKQVVSEDLNMQVVKPIGKDLPKDYRIESIIENKIMSAEQIYLQTEKYSRACKIFEEVLRMDPYAQRAWWDKILCTLEVVSFDDLKADAKLDLIFEMFESLMGCISPQDENIYLDTIESHFFRKLSEASQFDLPLFNFIASWKKVGEQHLFFDLLYQELIKKMQSENIASVDFVHEAIASSTKHISKKDNRFYKKYLDASDQVNRLGFYKDSMMLTSVILAENPNFVPAILIQLCAMYKVPELGQLHRVLRDMKFLKTLRFLLNIDYKSLEVFVEIKKSIIALIEIENFKLAVQMIDTYVSLLPKDEKKILNESLLEFSNHLIYHQKFSEAKKYVNQLIENDHKIPAAHWARFMITLKAHTHFDVLMSSPKKDLMRYTDFEQAVNCTQDHQEYIKFYEIQDKLKQPTPENVMFRKMTRRNFDYFDAFCKTEGVETFVNQIFPKIEKEVPKLFRSNQISVFNLFNRSVIMVILISFALVLSHMKTLFDPTNSVDSLVVAYNVLLLFRDTVIFFLVPGFLLIYTLIYVREKEHVGKAIGGGLFVGLIVSVISLVMLGGIPWVLARFLTPTLFGLSPFIIPGVTFGLVGIASIFIFRTAHLKLVEARVDHKFIKTSRINIIVLAVLLVIAMVVTYFTAII